MFRRLIPDDPAARAAIIAFVVTSAIFLYFFVRALLMKKPEADHLANLPLEPDTKPEPSSTSSHE